MNNLMVNETVDFMYVSHNLDKITFQLNINISLNFENSQSNVNGLYIFCKFLINCIYFNIFILFFHDSSLKFIK